MRIVFIYNRRLRNPLFLELVHRLHAENYDVCVFDFINSMRYCPTSGDWSHIDSFWISKWAIKWRFVRRFFIPFNNKRCIRREFHCSDVVNIHYLYPDYLQYVALMKEIGCKLISTIWGSDYLRARTAERRSYEWLFENSDAISMVSGIQDIFCREYEAYVGKVRTTFFGIKLFDDLRAVTEKHISDFRITHKVPAGKKTVTLGYNASPAQQHLMVLQELSNLDLPTKLSIHLFIPLSYGGNEIYIDEVIRLTKTTQISYTIFRENMVGMELATMRACSEVVINVQKTDAFSASISEFIAAGSLVLVGEWLPYAIYEDWGIKLIRIQRDNLLRSFTHALFNLQSYKNSLKKNHGLVIEHLSWSATLGLWKAVYNEAAAAQ